MSLDFTSPQPTPTPQEPSLMSTSLTLDEITMIKDILTRVADTIVQASSFATQLNSMQDRVQEVDAEITRVRNANVALDETIVALRRERDESSAIAQENLARANLYDTRCRELENERDNLNAHIGTLTKERDDALFRNLEADERIAKLEADLAKANHRIAGLRSAFAAFDDTPEAEPAPTQAPAPAPVEPAEPVKAETPPEPEAPDWLKAQAEQGHSGEPGTAATPRRIYPNEPGYNYGTALDWDADRREWYNVVHD